MEIKWGLVPDMAGIALLRELVRGDVARELAYSGRIINSRPLRGVPRKGYTLTRQVSNSTRCSRDGF